MSDRVKVEGTIDRIVQTPGKNGNNYIFCLEGAFSSYIFMASAGITNYDGRAELLALTQKGDAVSFDYTNKPGPDGMTIDNFENAKLKGYVLAAKVNMDIDSLGL